MFHINNIELGFLNVADDLFFDGRVTPFTFAVVSELLYPFHWMLRSHFFFVQCGSFRSFFFFFFLLIGQILEYLPWHF